ncbi:hypothetical protein TNCV_3717771 [Trichonephila clavipes]|nr:hypothetical protein TNCV_3717771 [Trichonephila clavipes]
MRAKAYRVYLRWWCSGQVVNLTRNPPVFSPLASLVLIYRPTEGMKGCVNLAQPWNRTPDLWCGSVMCYHSAIELPNGYYRYTKKKHKRTVSGLVWKFEERTSAQVSSLSLNRDFKYEDRRQ